MYSQVKNRLPAGGAQPAGNTTFRANAPLDRPVAGARRDDSIDLIDVVAWQRLAEVCGQDLKKGRLALVEGRIQNRSFEDQSGQRRWVTEVVAKNMTRLDGSPNSSPVAGSQVKEEIIDDSELESDLPF